jgi:hypothetical protein
LLLALVKAVILRSESGGTHGHIFIVSNSNFPNLDGKLPLFISPRNRVARLYLQALGSLFIASYDSQGYGGGIRTNLHRGAKNPIANGQALLFRDVLPSEQLQTPWLRMHGALLSFPLSLHGVVKEFYLTLKSKCAICETNI